MLRNIALVAVENTAYHFDILFSYAIPDALLESAKPGVRVQVPFGRGSVNRKGIIFRTEKAEADSNIKYIEKVLDSKPLLNQRMLSLALFLKDRTFCTYYEGAKIQLPVGFDFKLNVSYIAEKSIEEISLSEQERAVYDYILSYGAYISKKDICAELSLPEDTNIPDKLAANGALIKSYDATQKLGDISTKFVSLNYDKLDVLSLTEKQQDVVNVVASAGEITVKELCYFAGVSASVIATLEKKGLLICEKKQVYRIPKQFTSNDKFKRDIVLTKEQSNAFDSLMSQLDSGGTSLLYGVTGSGKTSVFLRLIDEVVKKNKDVLVMVPEIALTPQMMAIFKGRYGDDVAIFHSALSVGERKDEYTRVQNGEAHIVVGTRSAVFAPLENLGLIVIDEEQEHTYRSESSPRYHARDVALYRAHQSGALLVLSSATPSVDSFAKAKNGRYALCSLTQRYGNAVLPDVEIVDMKAEQKNGNRTNFSQKLQQLIRQKLELKEQVVLLMNRRGYNTYAYCDTCGEPVTCPYCSVSMTYHSANNRLMCHYCGYSVPFSRYCTNCNIGNITYAGTGTQKIEQELSAMFEGARVLRLDTDSVTSRFKFEKALSDFGSGEYDIMLGTQMVAKGLDFENVTLVGVINADTQLYEDDYKSSETTFDLLTQVVGRAGRGNKKGVALIQTFKPENTVITLAARQDYDSFFATEIDIRKAMIYPPFCDLCVITATSEDEAMTHTAVEFVQALIKKHLAGEYSDCKMIMLPATTPRVAKVNNKYRLRTLIKCRNNAHFRQMISDILVQTGKNKDIKNTTVIAEMNPLNC